MVISKPAEIQQAKTKRAWTCGHCGSVNDADDQECDACGNARDDSSDDTVTKDRLYKPGEEPVSGEQVSRPEETLIEGENYWHCPQCKARNHIDEPRCSICNLPKAERLTWRPPSLKNLKGARKGKARNIFLSIAGVVVLLLLGFIPKTVEVEVTGFAWARQLAIEDYAERSRSDWYSAPPGAYNISSREEIHHYDQVYSHTECHTETYSCGTRDNGNGTFSDEYCTRESCTDIYDDVPVYATKYYYNIMDWEYHHTENTAAEDHNPVWPSDSRTASDPGRWREGGREGTYYTYVRESSDEVQKREMEFERWGNTQVGDHETGKKAWLWGTWYGFD